MHLWDRLQYHFYASNSFKVWLSGKNKSCDTPMTHHRIAPKCTIPFHFGRWELRTATCRLNLGSRRTVMLKFLNKILYLHSLKIQKIIEYDLTACQLCKRSFMRTPSSGLRRCNITENRSRGFVILIPHKELLRFSRSWISLLKLIYFRWKFNLR